MSANTKTPATTTTAAPVPPKAPATISASAPVPTVTKVPATIPTAAPVPLVGIPAPKPATIATGAPALPPKAVVIGYRGTNAEMAAIYNAGKEFPSHAPGVTRGGHLGTGLYLAGTIKGAQEFTKGYIAVFYTTDYEAFKAAPKMWVKKGQDGWTRPEGPGAAATQKMNENGERARVKADLEVLGVTPVIRFRSAANNKSNELVILEGHDAVRKTLKAVCYKDDDPQLLVLEQSEPQISYIDKIAEWGIKGPIY